ncbi:proline-rich protein 5-like isoform X2 [Parambassis ranga]|uniref:Proline-rich protein 5-like isoform X2 n=1 Tax=Parambassis ranga TaxID=210632 RepID=A0A6P7KBP1_9TELE|nr:proline-rich protein 5-like isoform X2 [Parambassis ranga]
MSYTLLMRISDGSLKLKWVLSSNQLLTRGLSGLLEQILLHSTDENLLVILADMWDLFFTKILPTLQAIFYPVQGQGSGSVRQLALLAFRDLVMLKLHLEKTLGTAASIPPSVTQMLLVLQGVHEPRGPTFKYYQLECLVEIAVSPYLCNILHDRNQFLLGPCHLQSSVLLADQSQPEITITQHHGISDSSSLSPVVEQEGEGYLEKVGSVRRHTVASVHSDYHLLSNSHLRGGTKRDRKLGVQDQGTEFLVGTNPESCRLLSNQVDIVDTKDSTVQDEENTAQEENRN